MKKKLGGKICANKMKTYEMDLWRGCYCSQKKAVVYKSPFEITSCYVVLMVNIEVYV